MEIVKLIQVFINLIHLSKPSVKNSPLSDLHWSKINEKKIGSSISNNGWINLRVL